MIEFTQYAGRVRGFGGSLTGLPPWARFFVLVFALPGIALALAAVLLFLLSLFALMILAGPAYLFMRRVMAFFTPSPREHAPMTVSVASIDGVSSPGVKRVESTVVE